MPEPAYSKRFDAAVALAIDAFRPITRKGKDVPYIAHLLSVCAMVAEHGGDEDQMIAAVLHDYLEDIEGSTQEELAQRFGPRVARLVAGLSDSVVLPKPPWKERKVAYIAQLRGEPPELKLISCADKLHNCRGLVRDVRRDGLATLERFRGRVDGTLWYYQSVYSALREGWEDPPELLQELGDTVRALQDEIQARQLAGESEGAS